MAGNRTRNVDSIVMGEMMVMVAPSQPYINIDTPVLNEMNSMGKLTNTVLKVDKEFHDIVSGFPESFDGVIPLKETLTIECNYHEFTAQNIALAQGLDPFAAVPPTAIVVSQKSTAGTTDAEKLTVDTGAGWDVGTDTFIVTFTSATAFSVYGALNGQVGTGTKGTLFNAQVGGNKLFSLAADFFGGTHVAGDSVTIRTTKAYSQGAAYGANPFQARFKLGNPTPPAYIRVEAHYIFPTLKAKIVTIQPRGQVKSALNLSFGKDEGNAPLSFQAAKASADIVGGHTVWNDSPIGCILMEPM